jgi:hypothetical protein
LSALSCVTTSKQQPAPFLQAPVCSPSTLQLPITIHSASIPYDYLLVSSFTIIAIPCSIRVASVDHLKFPLFSANGMMAPLLSVST